MNTHPDIKPIVSLSDIQAQGLHIIEPSTKANPECQNCGVIDCRGVPPTKHCSQPKVRDQVRSESVL